jgi:hypothetical protein
VLNTFTQLCPNAGPVIHAFKIQSQSFFLSARDWIEKTNPFNSSAIALVATVCYHYVIERPFLGTASCQPDFYHFKKPFLWNMFTSDTPALFAPTVLTTAAYSRAQETGHFNRI